MMQPSDWSSRYTAKADTDSLKKVTVFTDRAEIRRLFLVPLEQGRNEVVIENVSHMVIEDSIRVVGRGSAVIEEVQLAIRPTITGVGDSQRAKQLREQKTELEKSLKQFDREKATIQKRIEALDTMLGEVGSGIASPQSEKFSADEATLGNLRSALSDKEEEEKEAAAKLAVLKHDLNKLEHMDRIRVVTVILDSKTNEKVELELTYQVYGACWTPSYDIRVDARNGKTEMLLAYFGSITQSTGEDWDGAARLVLSTARPALGGSIPELGALELSFRRLYTAPPTPVPAARGRFAMRSNGIDQYADSASEEMALGAFDETVQEKCAVATATTANQLLSAEFAIARFARIPTDGAQHKVTIGIVRLTPDLLHETVPSRNLSAFLTASCVNTSSMPLLEGEASIYLDGAFVNRTHLKAVSPGERFRSSLGIDPAVKVEYKPLAKFHQVVGMINKASMTTYEQAIIVHNTRSDAILLKIKEPLPRPTDERIKVRILYPEALERVPENQEEAAMPPSPGARVTPSFNMEWTIALDRGECRSLPVKYIVEHPAAEPVEFVVKYK